MIHKISLWENVSNLVEVRFFTNKNKAIQYGKEQSKNLSYESEWGESSEVVYTIQSVKKPKTQKQWMMFLNFHSYTEG
tara:strand:- start:773 stop:1006 length:234 start_codon:yes stop_codon:yes gene_type:complete